MELTKEKALWLYEKMVQTRKFEKRCEKLNKEKAILGSIHGSIGEEAVSVGLAALLREEDVLAPSYRDVGALFTKGLTTLDLMGMLFAKECGKTNGRTRVLHVGDIRKGIYPPNPILGASSVIGNGAALAFKMDGKDNVVVNVMGDGASNEGAVHEAMNFAAVNDLPIIFAIENNFYAWSRPYEKNFRIKSLADRGYAYGIPGYIADGNDLMDVLKNMEQAIGHAREGKGPSIVECRTYRLSGHSANDKNLYRTEEEIIKWKQNCPIRKFSGYLVMTGLCKQEELDAVSMRMEEEVKRAVELSMNAGYPDEKEFFDVGTMLANE